MTTTAFSPASRSPPRLPQDEAASFVQCARNRLQRLRFSREVPADDGDVFTAHRVQSNDQNIVGHTDSFRENLPPTRWAPPTHTTSTATAAPSPELGPRIAANVGPPAVRLLELSAGCGGGLACGGIVRIGRRDLLQQDRLALVEGEPFGEGGAATGQLLAVVPELGGSLQALRPLLTGHRVLAGVEVARLPVPDHPPVKLLSPPLGVLRTCRESLESAGRPGRPGRPVGAARPSTAARPPRTVRERSAG